MVTTLAPPPAPTIALRPYQLDALDAIERARADGRMAASVYLPTGTGKTVLFSELIRRWNVRTLLIAHREELLSQASTKLLTVWPGADIGLVGAGHAEPGHRVTIGSVQSITRPARLARLESEGVELVIVDECHHASARSYQRILAALHAGQPGGNCFLLGVTATPDRADGASIEAIFGEPVAVATLPNMVRDGYLCNLRGVRVETAVRLDGIRQRAGDFAVDDLAAAVNTPARNAEIVEAYLRHGADRPALVFAVDVEHAHALAEAFDVAGIAASALDGETPRDERQRILTDYAAGRIRVVSNCAVLTEGFDAPATACVVLARPTQSRSLYCQMVGRGTRPAPGKADCLVLDVADLTSKHSLTVMSLPKLVGRKGYTVTAKGHGAGSDDDDEREDDAFDLRNELAAGLPRKVTDRDVDLLEPWKWQPIGNGAYRLDLDDRHTTLWLVLRETGYIAGVIFPDGHRQELTQQPTSLDWAQLLAERAAAQIAKGNAHYVDLRAPWRGAPASDKQLALMRKLHIRSWPGMTKGEAALAIDRRLANNAS